MENILVLVRKILDLSVEKLKVVFDLSEKLSGTDGESWFTELKKFLRKEKCWINDLLLVFVGTVVIPKTTKKFIVAEHFVVGKSGKGRPAISWLGDNLKEWFWGKVECPADEATLRYDDLAKNSVDKPILAELGDRAETTMSQIYSLMGRQPNGEDGILLNTGRANIFYVRDKKGVLRAVDVHWYGDDWYVRAGSVEGPFGWVAGGLIFSRN